LDPHRDGLIKNVEGAPRARAHIGWVEEARGVLSLYVVLHHALLNIDYSGVHDGTWRWLDAVFAWGHVSVDAFLVLSAFCLVLPLGASDRFDHFGPFLRRRFARLLPPYYAACLFSLALIALCVSAKSGTHWDVSVPVTFGGAVTHALLIHQWWPQFTAQIDHPLWSIGVEFQLCFLLPLLVWSCGRIGPWRTVAAFTLVGYLTWRASVSIGFPDPSAWGASLYYISLFAMGVAVAHLWSSPPQQWRPRRDEALPVVAVAVAMTAWLAVKTIRDHAVALQLLSFFVGLTVVAGVLAMRRWPMAAPEKRGPLRASMAFVGKRSYSLYLIHAPLLQVVWIALVSPMHLSSSGLQAIAMMLLGTTVSLVFTLVFFQWIERPSLDWSRRLPSK